MELVREAMQNVWIGVREWTKSACEWGAPMGAGAVQLPPSHDPIASCPVTTYMGRVLAVAVCLFVLLGTFRFGLVDSTDLVRIQGIRNYLYLNLLHPQPSALVRV